VQVSLLRRRLGADVVSTVAGRGYRLSIALLDEDEATVDTPRTHVDSPDNRRIAVLGFRASGSDQAQRDIARGLAYDLLTELSRNSDVRVIAHQSSFAFAGDGVPLRNIGERLRVRYLVDGSLERRDDVLTLRIELIDAFEEHVVWSSQHPMRGVDLSRVREDLLGRICASVHATSQYMDTRRALGQPARSLDIYGQLWRAIGLMAPFTPQATVEARALLEQALKVEENYAPAWAWLAHLNAMDAMMRTTGEWHPGRAAEYMGQARRALAIDADNPTAYRALSLAFRASGEFDAALGAARRAMELSPANSHCMQTLSEVQCAVGDVQQALAGIENAMELHPYPPAWVSAVHGLALWACHRCEDALAAADEGIAELPHYWPARVVRMYALHELGERTALANEGAAVLQLVPKMSALALTSYWQNTAIALRSRVSAAALEAGIPAGQTPRGAGS